MSFTNRILVLWYDYMIVLRVYTVGTILETYFKV